jgi:hypothetical protein
MSLIDKSININASSASVLSACIIEAIYPIITSIFLNSSIDNDNSMIYFDLEKKNGIGFQVNSVLLSIKYLINNNQYIYNYLTSSRTNDLINDCKKIYYNISANKDIISFSFTEGILDFGIGYQKEIGYFEFWLGNLHYQSNIDPKAHLFIQNNNIYKEQIYNYNFSSRWLSTELPSITLNQLPLFVIQGNFNSLYEVSSCATNRIFNKNEVINSKGKYYRLLYSYVVKFTGLTTDRGNSTVVFLAMEVADD